MSITAVNLLDPAEFTRVFGNVVEHAPSIAAVLARRRPLRDTQHLLAELYSIMDGLSDSGEYRQLSSPQRRATTRAPGPKVGEEVAALLAFGHRQPKLATNGSKF